MLICTVQPVILYNNNVYANYFKIPDDYEYVKKRFGELGVTFNKCKTYEEYVNEYIVNK